MANCDLPFSAIFKKEIMLVVETPAVLYNSTPNWTIIQGVIWTAYESGCEKSIDSLYIKFFFGISPMLLHVLRYYQPHYFNNPISHPSNNCFIREINRPCAIQFRRVCVTPGHPSPVRRESRPFRDNDDNNATKTSTRPWHPKITDNRDRARFYRTLTSIHVREVYRTHFQLIRWRDIGVGSIGATWVWD